MLSSGVCVASTLLHLLLLLSAHCIVTACSVSCSFNYNLLQMLEQLDAVAAKHARRGDQAVANAEVGGSSQQQHLHCASILSAQKYQVHHNTTYTCMQTAEQKVCGMQLGHLQTAAAARCYSVTPYSQPLLLLPCMCTTQLHHQTSFVASFGTVGMSVHIALIFLC